MKSNEIVINWLLQLTESLEMKLFSRCLFPSGQFFGEEGGRAGEWNTDEWWGQVQAEAGEHTTSTQVQTEGFILE